MTPETQRIAIAEACGWRWNVQKGDGLWWVHNPGGGGGGMTQEIDAGYFFSVFGVPDYVNDLNAMHEAEKTLNRKKTQYIGHLQAIGGRERFGDSYLATAAQRAEAFLRTLGLWKEEEKP